MCKLSEWCCNVSEIWDELSKVVHHTKDVLYGKGVLRDWHVCDRFSLCGAALMPFFVNICPT